MTLVIEELEGHRVETVVDGAGFRCRCECGWGGRLTKTERKAIRTGAMHCAREDVRKKLHRSV